MATNIDQEVQQAVAEANRRFADALWNKDEAALATLFTADAQLLPPHLPLLAGRDAVLAFWARAVADPLVRVRSELETTEIVAIGDVAVETGRATISRASADAETVVDRGKYMVVWKREDGSWRMHRDIFNSDLPLPS